MTDRIRTDTEAADAALPHARIVRAEKSPPTRVRERAPLARMPRPKRGCDELLRRAHLLPYLQASASDADANAFEAHLLRCAVCFRDLKALARARRLIDELSLAAPQRRPSR